MNIFEVMQYGPIVACDEELGLLVTVNGAYFNLWVSRGDGEFENTTCSSPGAPDTESPLLWKTVKRAEKRLKEWISEDEENEDEQDE